MVQIGNDWDVLLQNEFQKPYYLQLRKFLIHEYKSKIIYPNMYDIFNAFKYTSYEAVKIVIIGQDPYHGPNQAHGLSFSVKRGIDIPPSLLNIYKELQNDCGCYIPNNGYLMDWTKQGVMLLNAVLTVRAGQANSHRGKGWENFTNQTISLLNKREKPVIFLLWGNNAKEKMQLITNPQHVIFTSVHPSPLSASRGFFGCKHFTKANEVLRKMGEKEINWQIQNI